ncbi:MAG: 1-acyl-sn-glycerol-3-phosphate acyltransferase, partial [Flavobacteriales bacterium]|nr:1-acyl-sn-glycerol-3-phosphate acyltransferase [Flavobacteriales bacterium]
QAILICLWTAASSCFTFILLLFTFNQALSFYIVTRYLWSPVMLLIAGVRVKVNGQEQINRHIPAIYVANHASHWDIVALVRVMPMPMFFVAKKELGKIPFLGWAMRAVGMILIDRSNKEAAMKSMEEAAEKIRRGKNVISFPEGTRTKTGEVGLFKRGSFLIALDGKIHIHPIGISGSRAVLPSGSFKLRPGVINVHIGQRIEPDNFSGLSVETLASTTRDTVIQLIGDK